MSSQYGREGEGGKGRPAVARGRAGSTRGGVRRRLRRSEALRSRTAPAPAPRVSRRARAWHSLSRPPCARARARARSLSLSLSSPPSLSLSLSLAGTRGKGKQGVPPRASRALREWLHVPIRPRERRPTAHKDDPQRTSRRLQAELLLPEGLRRRHTWGGPSVLGPSASCPSGPCASPASTPDTCSAREFGL